MSGSPLQPERLLRRLEWTVIRRLDGLLQGDYRTLFRGFGLDLADLREYQAFDDVRHIDWNVTARTQVPHVRVFNEDRDIAAWFFLDLSPSVDFGSGEISKRQILIEFTAVLARLLTRQGNKVGAILFDGVREHVLPPHGGRRQVLHIIDRVGRLPRLPRSPATDLGAALARAFSIIKGRRMLFVVSDFISRPGWPRVLARASQKHEGVAVRLVDPLERILPDLGLLAFTDAETGEQMLVDTNDRAFRRRFAAEAEKSEAALLEAFGDANVDVLELSTGDDLVDAILRFSQLRKLRSGAAPQPAGAARPASPRPSDMEGVWR